MLGGDSSGHGYLWPIRHYDALPTVIKSLGAVWEDMVHGKASKVGDIPEGLSAVVGSGGH